MFYRVHKRPLRSVVSSSFRDCLRSVGLTVSNEITKSKQIYFLIMKLRLN